MVYLDCSLPADVAEIDKRFDLGAGRFIQLDVPHYMEPEIPQRIAKEVEKVIAQT
jgi:hypothetical protein